MASLRRKDGSKYWFACFTLPNGKQAQRSTRQTDRKKAQKVADAFERVAQQKMSEGHVRKVMADLFEQVNDAPLASSTVRKYGEAFLEKKEKESSKATFVRYRQIIGEFSTMLGDRVDMDLGFVTVSDVTKFRDWYSGRLSATTANIALKMLRAFFQSAWKAELITDNPAAKVDLAKSSEEITKRRAFTLPELQKILAAAKGEWRGIILFGLYTGARLGDIGRLTWANIHGLETETPEVRFRTQKTGRQQIIPLAPTLLRYLRGEEKPENAPTAAIFPKASAIVSGQERAGTLSNGFYDVMRDAGLVGERSRKNTGKGRSNRRQTTELSFHSLRHTTTSLLKAAGISASVAMDIVGHDTPAISQHYTHIEYDIKRSALNKLPDLI